MFELIVTIIILVVISFILNYKRIKDMGRKEDISKIKVRNSIPSLKNSVPSLLNLEIIKNFESYMAVLEYHMRKAYDIIFKDQIMIYSVEAIKVDDKHFEEVSKQFIKLVLKLIGPMLQNEFEYMYGNRETFLFNITEFFNTKYEDDEVRKASQKQLMEDNDE